METGCPAPDEIDALLAGRLEAARVDAVRDHLDGCSDCRVLVGTLAKDDASGSAATVNERGAPRGSEPGVRVVRIDRYVVERRLGSGGMGVVYLAEDPELKRHVVIKLLRPELVGPGDLEDRARLLREAQAMAKVSHPNVVPIHDVGVHDDQVFLAMEFVDGSDLAAWLAAENRTVPEIVAVFTAAGRGLAAAHRAGLVHRDFKPHNVMVGKDGTVKVTDFGLARSELPPPGERPALARDRARLISRSADLGAATLLESPITQTGAMVGTPAYMAPEQILGQFVDARSDQFSFCVALYEALYRERPFRGQTTAELFDSTLEGRIPSSIDGNRRVPGTVRDALRRGLAVEPGERFPSMDDLLAALAPRRSRRPLVIALAAGAVMVAGATGLAVWSTRARPAPCTGGATELAPVWNPTRRRAIERAFLATGATMARPAFAAVSASVDRYAGTWIAGHAAACAATRVRGEQSEDAMELRMQCLRQRRAELDALLAALAQPDAAVMASPGTIVSALPSPTACDNVEALRTTRLPVAPAIRDEVERIELVVATARAAHAAHRYEDATTRLAAALARAEQTGHKPLVAEIELELGLLAATRNDLPGAEQHLQRAIRAAEPVGADAIRARALLGLIDVAIAEGKPDQADVYAGFADATIERLGHDPQLAAELDVQLGGIKRSRGDFAGAEAAYRTAIEHKTSAFGAASAEVALVHQALGLLYNEARDYDHAFEELGAARDTWTAAIGADSAEVASALTIMSAIRNYQGRNDEALALGQEAIDHLGAYFGADHYQLAQSYQSQANILQAEGKTDEAIAMAEKSVAILAKAQGAQDPMTASALESLALAYSNAGRHDEAIATFARALDAFRAAYGDNHEDVALTLNGMGVVRKRQGRYDEALALYDQARAIIAKIKEPGSQLMADTLTRIGSLHLLRKRPAEAVTVLEQALGMRIAAKAAAASTAWTRGELAKALWDAKADRTRAAALARDAAAEAKTGGDAALAAELEAWLASHAP